MTTSQTTHSIAHSADGTPIAYESYGTGPVMVVVVATINYLLITRIRSERP